MFAPYTASSLWIRSPIVVASASIAVTAVVPSRIATPASILRRRCLRKLSISRRKNISVPSPFPQPWCPQHSPKRLKNRKTESLKTDLQKLLVLPFPSPFPHAPSPLKHRCQLAQIRSLNHH